MRITVLYGTIQTKYVLQLYNIEILSIISMTVDGSSLEVRTLTEKQKVAGLNVSEF